MELLWHGFNCFSIKTKKGTAVVNPYKDTGLKMPNLKGAVALLTEENSKYNNVDAVEGDKKIFAWPGEYEVSEIAITMEQLEVETKSGNKPMLVSIDAENMHICYISDLSFSMSDELVEKIGSVDVLLVPAHMEKDGYDMVHQAIEEIEPRYIVPIYYKTEGLKVELNDLAAFTKKGNLGAPEAKDKLVLNSRADLPQEKTEFVILNPQVG